MKLIVGLGNPGEEYDNTRHNTGFRYIDAYAKEHNVTIDKDKFNGLYAKVKINNEDVILLKPQKFMNLSGEVVKAYVDYYKIAINEILIISDDLDLPVGKYRLRLKGKSGGHNGLKNIEACLGTDEYKRLKIGISNIKDMATKDYVLGHNNTEEKKVYNDIEPNILQLLDDFSTLTFANLMNKYNNN